MEDYDINTVKAHLSAFSIPDIATCGVEENWNSVHTELLLYTDLHHQEET